jgi:chitinase
MTDWMGWLALVCVLLLAGPARAGFWVTGYYPGYVASRMAASNIDFTTITHVIHFSVVPQSNGTINTSDNSLTTSAVSNLVKLVHAAGRPVLICVGGAGTESGFLGATTPANLGVFTNNLFKFMATNGYDGVDLDWEPFNSSDTNQYTNFVVAMRGLLGTNRLFTVAAPAYPEYGDSPTAEFAMLAAVQNKFDQINIESYDLSGAYEGWVTWYNSPLFDGGYKFPGTSELVPSINGAVSNFVNNGVSPGKLGLGMPFYGDVWTDGPGVDQPRQAWPAMVPPTVTAYTYAEIMQSYYQPALYHWDSVAEAPYLSITNTTTATNDMFIPYDDTNSCMAKVSLARNLRLGGMMLWELTQDYISTAPTGQRTPLVAAIKQSLTTPAIVGPKLSGTNFGFSFTTLPVGLYRILWTTNLALGTWNTLSNNVAGTGSNIFISDPAGSAGRGRFYQVQTPP